MMPRFEHEPGRSAVKLEGLEVITNDSRDDYPVRLRSANGCTITAAMLSRLREPLSGLLDVHGALMFESADFGDALEFRDLVGELIPTPRDDISEHQAIDNVSTVYAPTPYPKSGFIPWHNENSHLRRWPNRIIFGCLIAAETGGVTCIADCRQVYRHLPQEVRETFEQRGLRYQRTCGGGTGLDWKTLFRTEDRGIATAAAVDSGYDVTWIDEHRLRLRWTSQVSIPDPAGNGRLWYNQLTHFHPFFLQEDMRRAITELFSEEELPRDCRFADGMQIPDELSAEVAAAYTSCQRGTPWRKFEVLLLDNRRMAHGRTPYAGERNLLVAMGD